MFLARVQSQAAWQAGRLGMLPAAWRARAGREHGRKFKAAGGQSDAERAANNWLLDLTDRAGAIRIPLTMSDEDLCRMARDKARECLSLGASEWSRHAAGVQLDSVESARLVERLRKRLAGYVDGYGIAPPAPLVVCKQTGKRRGVEDRPAIARMTAHLWWRRRLRVAQGRAIEAEAIRLGYVHRRAEIYVSNLTNERRQQQRARNARVLADTSAVNLDTGQVFALADLAERSNASPRIRRGELMVRIRGFEEIARGLGDAAEFVTLTCPSRMHSRRMAGDKVEENPRYDGTTPKEAQAYLVTLWANLRAALWRRRIRVYGFRIAEPHHDGPPHWHLLLFMSADLGGGRAAAPRFRAIFRRYALKVDGNEPGARKHRAKFVRIDLANGSAAGYIAKYVAKNIDGYSVGIDLEGNDAIASSMRVDAWASTWGIRQFQQIGGAPVGVWRELRRVSEEAASASPIVAAARRSADGIEVEGARRADWAGFVAIMGGPFAGRDAWPIRCARTAAGERWNPAAGQAEPAPLNAYGEVAAPNVYGVVEVADGEPIAAPIASTRYRWEIKRGGVGAQGEGAAPGARGSREGAAGAAPFGFAVAASAKPSPPRTRVNNCSQGSDSPIWPPEPAGAWSAPPEPAGAWSAPPAPDPAEFWLKGANLENWKRSTGRHWPPDENDGNARGGNSPPH